jgi:hypothetical protein
MVIRLAGGIVPSGSRSDWRRRWTACLRDLATLIARGEFPRGNATELRWYCGAALADAFEARFSGADLQRWLGAPALLLLALSSLILILAACTGGFTVTRSLISSGGERVVPYALVVAFAMLISVTIAVRFRAQLKGHDWRYWSFLLLKTGAAMAILTDLWIEGGFTLRMHIANDTLRALGGGLLLTVIYAAATGAAMLWCLSDQQRRCPVCLRLMAAPVRIGSWASIFEPVITELLCNEGHGTLCVQECDTGEPDRWLALELR